MEIQLVVIRIGMRSGYVLNDVQGVCVEVYIIFLILICADLGGYHKLVVLVVGDVEVSFPMFRAKV